MRTLRMNEGNRITGSIRAAAAICAFGVITPLLGGESRCDSVFEKLARVASIATRAECESKGLDTIKVATLAAALTRSAGTTRLWAEGKCDSIIATLDTAINLLSQDMKCDEQIDSIGLKCIALQCEASVFGSDASALQAEYNAKYEGYVAGKIPERKMLAYARTVQVKLDSLKTHYREEFGEMLKLKGKVEEIRKTKKELSVRLQKLTEEQGKKAR